MQPCVFLDEDARFRAAVLEGRDFMEEGEMDVRFEEPVGSQLSRALGGARRAKTKNTAGGLSEV